MQIRQIIYTQALELFFIDICTFPIANLLWFMFFREMLHIIQKNSLTAKMCI